MEIFIALGIIGIFVIVTITKKSNELAKLSPEERKFGPLAPDLACPHCQTSGQVRTKLIRQTKGLSTPKMTAAVITGGLSMLAIGLFRKEIATQAHCDSCSATWII